MCHSPVPFIHRSRNYHWSITDPTVCVQTQTQVTAFHLRNKEANRSLKVKWNRTKLENTPHPKYLCVTLDRTQSYKEHMYNTKMKVATRSNLLRKLSNSRRDHLTRRTLAQLSTNKSPFLKSYLHKVDAKTHPSPLCPLCNIHTSLQLHPHCRPWICGQTPLE